MDITGIGSVADLAKSVINKIWPDKSEQEKQQMAIALSAMQNEMALAQGQMDTNKVEAGNPTLFISGWRPFVGWVCGSACAWNWVGLPIVKALMGVFHKDFPVAPADLTQMLPLLMGMLGMGALRTYEKLNGVAAK